MPKNSTALVRALLVAAFLAGGPGIARRSFAAEPKTIIEDRVTRLEKLLAETRAELDTAKKQSSDEAKWKEVERKIDILTREIEELRLGKAPAPEASASRTGLGPAASKVYSARKGVSIGGYGEVVYQNFASRAQDGSPSGLTDRVDLQRAVLYFGYKFDDHFLFNSELEVEHGVTASDKGGETEVEFAYLDWQHVPAFNVRAGLMLIPVGLINEFHEPPVFLGVRRPDVEQVIIPSTWREIGIGACGDAGPFSYRAYLVNGLDSSRYAADGIGEGSGEGSEAAAKNWAGTARLDYTGWPGSILGASLFAGDSGQGSRTPDGKSFSGLTVLWDVHGEWRWRGIELRGLYAQTRISDAAKINEANGFSGDESVGSRQKGWYLQAGYNVLSLFPGAKAELIPFLRYEDYNTQDSVPAGYEPDPANHVRELTVGASFKPIPNLVVKTDWQRRHNDARTGVNQFNAGLGYLF